jgi:hypothetical protein
MWLIKLKTFLKSLIFHIYAGSPKSTKNEILARLSFCTSCEHFNTKRQECGICGCAISDKSIFMNKLAWADQECPVGKWGKIIRIKEKK